jgi:hypothetical protein
MEGIAMTRLSVFESYSRTDEKMATQIAADLTEIGLDVWRDQRLSGGQEWWDTILASIRAADVILFVVSENSLDSVPCNRELDYAFALGKPVLPVRVDQSTSPKLAPPVLASKEWVDYDADNKASTLRLMRAMNDISPAGPLPDPLPVEPDVPLSYTTNLAALVHQAKELTQAEQHSLLFQLRDGLRSKVDREECATLLTKLRARRELLASVAAEIDRALQDWAIQQAETMHNLAPAIAGPKRQGITEAVQAPAPAMEVTHVVGDTHSETTPSGIYPPGPPVAPEHGARPSPPSVQRAAKGTSIGRTLAVIGGIVAALAAVLVVILISSGSDTDQGAGPNPEPVNPDPGGEPEPPDQPFAYGDDPSLDALWDSCASGDLAACDQLYIDSEIDSAYEDFGATCGDRTDGLTGNCATDLPFPYIYGDDPDLDALWDSCADGDLSACDQLYTDSEIDSVYEDFGSTCGYLVDPVNGYCSETFT